MTRIPACDARARVSGIAARSSSRYITATLAPTNRKGRPSITNWLPRVRTNEAGSGRSFEGPRPRKKKNAAPTANASATVAITFLTIKRTIGPLGHIGPKQIGGRLPWVRQSDEAHNRTDGPDYNKEVEEREDAKHQTAVFG